PLPRRIDSEFDPPVLTTARSSFPSRLKSAVVATRSCALNGEPAATAPIPLSAVPPSIFARPSRVLAIVALAVVFLSGAGFAWWRLARANNNGGRYEQVSCRQLTNNGIVFNATLSADGKFFAFVKVQKEKESLRVGQTNSTEQIELRP